MLCMEPVVQYTVVEEKRPLAYRHRNRMCWAVGGDMVYRVFVGVKGLGQESWPASRTLPFS